MKRKTVAEYCQRDKNGKKCNQPVNIGEKYCDHCFNYFLRDSDEYDEEYSKNYGTKKVHS